MTARRPLQRLAAALAVASMLAVTAPATAAPSYPILAGTTVLTFEGTSGVVLRVPERVSLTRTDIDVVLEGAPFAYGRLSPEIDNCHVTQLGAAEYPGEPARWWCGDYQFRVERDWVASPWVDAWADELLPGLVEVYVLTEGRVTLTLTVPELDGELRLTATGEVTGEAAALPVGCPTQEHTGCEMQGGGGVTFEDIRRPAMVSALAYAQRSNAAPVDPGLPTPGSVAAAPACRPTTGTPTSPPSRRPPDRLRLRRRAEQRE